MVRVDKEVLRTTMLGLEADALKTSLKSYEQYLANARLDRTETRDAQDFSQALQNGHYAQAFDAPVHEHEAAIAQIEGLDFGEAETVRAGSVVRWEGQSFVISVLTEPFECQGEEFMGISCDAPIVAAMLGKSAGDEFQVGSMTHVIDDVY